jgi:hypothetical protein
MAMRILFAPATVFFVLAGAFQASAETKVFIVENHRDGYGVDQCLASGSSCGKPMASAYCESRKFGQALSFRKVEPEEVTGGSGGVEASCSRGLCGEYVAIECTR